MYGMGAVIIYGSSTTSSLFPEIKNLIGLIINFPIIIAAFTLSYLLSKYNRKTILQVGTLLMGFVNIMIAVGFLTQKRNLD